MGSTRSLPRLSRRERAPTVAFCWAARPGRMGTEASTAVLSTPFVCCVRDTFRMFGPNVGMAINVTTKNGHKDAGR